MTPDDLKELAKLIQLLRESPEIGSIEISGWFGKRLAVTRNASRPASAAEPGLSSRWLAEPAGGRGAPPRAGSGLDPERDQVAHGRHLLLRAGTWR